jgi:hypothetical protein
MEGPAVRSPRRGGVLDEARSLPYAVPAKGMTLVFMPQHPSAHIAILHLFVAWRA